MAKRTAIKPMRSWRSEMASFSLVALFPVAVLSIFPFDAVWTPDNLRSGKASKADDERFRFAFVDMDIEDSERAIWQLCSSWLSGTPDGNSRHHYMPLGDLPEEESAVIGARMTPGPIVPLPLPRYTPSLRLDSLAAPAPVKIERKVTNKDTGQETLPFSREELLAPGL